MVNKSFPRTFKSYGFSSLFIQTSGLVSHGKKVKPSRGNPMSATIGIQLITPATGTARGQVQQQAEDNAAKATANAVADNEFADAIKQSRPPSPTSNIATARVDRSA
jgi:hypothetical protein